MQVQAQMPSSCGPGQHDQVYPYAFPRNILTWKGKGCAKGVHERLHDDLEEKMKLVVQINGPDPVLLSLFQLHY